VTARRRGGALLAAVGLVVACTPITAATEGTAAPVNACPCSAYEQPGAVPQCNGGACVVAATFSDLVLAVSLSQDSYFAPGQTFVIPYSQLFGFQCAPTPCPCVAPECAELPPYGVVAGAYLVTPQMQQTLDWNLGNVGDNTALPVHVTYRPLWPQSGATATAPEALGLGLPVLPVDADVLVDRSASHPPGPNGGVSIYFEGYLQPADYECTMEPDPPFEAAFPPDVQRVTIAAGNQVDEEVLRTVDLTTRNPPSTTAMVPTFDLSRVEGLDGWTAYLRDMTSLRRISTVATLAGTKAHVSLPTNHHPSDGDAFTNAELVVQPPAGQPIPTGVFPPTPLSTGVVPMEESYLPLPAVARVFGNVAATDSAVEADLVFEALDIYTAGQQLPNAANYEYTGLATARVDDTGGSTYSITLPPGDYRLTIRPLDLAHALTILPFTLLPSDGTQVERDLSTEGPRSVQGSAVVSDGRPLSGATVVALPVACAEPGSTVCLPRGGQTTTQSDGSFSLSLDPGSYQLRIEPQDGTRFPWVVQPLLVGATPVTVPRVTVSAPVYAGLQLLDAYGNPIVAAVVRIYQVPAQAGASTAVEIGRAITDATGHYDMYLAPTSQ